MMPKQISNTSPGSVLSLRGTSVPAAIVARVDDAVIGYRDLAALPRNKAILDIDRPDLMIYQPHYCYSPLERSLSPRSLSPPSSPENLVSMDTREWLESRSPGGSSSGSSVKHTAHTHSSAVTMATRQHFHRPDDGTNMYKKPPVYTQVRRGPPQVREVKHTQDLIIQSSRFPAAKPPVPGQASKIESLSWPCPPSLAVVEKEYKERRSRKDEEEEDDVEDLAEDLKQRQKQQLNKIQSNLGKIILKEEMGKPRMACTETAVPGGVC